MNESLGFINEENTFNKNQLNSEESDTIFLTLEEANPADLPPSEPLSGLRLYAENETLKAIDSFGNIYVFFDSVGGDTIYVNTINEYTTNNGVTVDGVKIKDSSLYIYGADVANTTTQGAAFVDGDYNRKLSLYSAANNVHQFGGLGTENTGDLRCQLSSTAKNMKWYAATGAAASSEVFQVVGSGGIKLPTTGGTQGIIDFYEEFSLNFEVGNMSLSPNMRVTCTFVRIGKIVTMNFGMMWYDLGFGPIYGLDSVSVLGSIAINTSIPARFCPGDDGLAGGNVLRFPLPRVVDTVGNDFVNLLVYSNGFMVIYSNAVDSNFNPAEVFQTQATSVSWATDQFL